MVSEKIPEEAKIQITKRGREWEPDSAPDVAFLLAPTLEEAMKTLETVEPFSELEVLETPEHPGVIVADADTMGKLEKSREVLATSLGEHHVTKDFSYPGIERGTFELAKYESGWVLQASGPDIVGCPPDFDNDTWDVGHQSAVEVVVSSTGAKVAPRLFKLNAERLKIPTVFYANSEEGAMRLVSALKEIGNPVADAYEFRSREDFCVVTDLQTAVPDMMSGENPYPSEPFCSSPLYNPPSLFKPSRFAVLIELLKRKSATFRGLVDTIEPLDTGTMKESVMDLKKKGFLKVEKPPSYIH